MATSNNALGAAGSGTTLDALALYLRDFAEPNLFENYELVPLGTEAVVPGSQGLHMYIPSYTNDATSGVMTHADVTASEELGGLSEGSVLSGLRTVTVTSDSRKLTYFTDGFKFSKLYETTKTVQGSIERAAQFLMVSSAKTQDKLVQNNLIYASGNGLTQADATGTLWGKDTDAPGFVSGEPIYVSPMGDTTAWGAIGATDYVLPQGFAQGRKFLRKQSAPPFQKLNKKFAAVVGPDTVFQLQTQVSTTGATVTFERDSMNYTDVYRGNVKFDLFGFAIIESDALPIIVEAGAGNEPGATGVDCEINFLFAPDAFYVCPHEVLRPQLYFSGFDEGGALNPFKSVAALGMDYLFGALRGPEFDKKLCLMPVPV